MIKYRAWPTMTEIVPVEILRETEKMIVMATDSCYYKNGERRELKRTKDYAYFNAWQDAKDFIVIYWNREVANIEAKATMARENRRKADAMQEPAACKKMEE